MSYQSAPDADCRQKSGAVSLLIKPKEKDLGEFTVRRVLPAMQQKMVGPFIFFDHMGPADFLPGQGIQVRPHPHIGIATITYLFEGEIMHADSLGFHQAILPGAVNLMTAGRGIVHSERAGSDLDTHSRLHGIQSWIALPDGQEEIEPAFVHTPATDLPQIDQPGITLRIIMGEAFGEHSPVTTYSPTLYVDCVMEAGATLQLPRLAEQTAIYVAEGELAIGGTVVSAGAMAVVADQAGPALTSNQASRCMIIGGDPVGERHIWWNFVSSSKDRIEQAKLDWRGGSFDAVPGDDEFIPLPE